jgi:hypothetical protein
MNDQERQDEIAKLQRLANDKAHIHKHALRLAGQYLSQAGQEIAETESSKLDEEIFEDQELLTAHENLIDRIAKDLLDQSNIMTRKEA